MKQTTKTTWTVMGWLGTEVVGSTKVHLTSAGGRLHWDHLARGAGTPHRFESHDLALIAAQMVRLGPPDYVPSADKTSVQRHNETVFLQDGKEAVAEDPGDKATMPRFIMRDLIAGAAPIEPASVEAMKAERARRFYETDWTVEAIQRETGFRMVLSWLDASCEILSWRPAGYPVHVPPAKFWSMEQAFHAAKHVRSGPPVVTESIRAVGFPASMPTAVQVEYLR